MPSTVIRSFHYHASQRRLEIVFVTGRRYSYHDVPSAIFEAMQAAFSKGEFFNACIRDHFPFTRER
jgi:lysyl-tRNA synthetase class 2